MMSAVRKRLKDIAKDPRAQRANAGLWLDRYYPAPAEEAGPAKTEHFKGAAGIPCPQGYVSARARRANGILNRRDGVTTSQRIFVPHSGRCVVGIGEAVGLENGITLNHIWGVPMLPGSSLKGVAAAAAHQLLEDPAWRVGRESHNALFGTTEMKGIVTFHDAWAILEDGDSNGLALDVMTNHYSTYYLPQQKQITAPHGMENPIPVSFITSTCGFEIILEVDHKLAGEHAETWLDTAWELLQYGLQELGVGAKTNAGYGRFYLDKSSIEVGALVEELESDLDALKNKTEGHLSKRNLYEKWVIEKADELLALASVEREKAASLLWGEFRRDRRFSTETRALREKLQA